MQKGKDESGTQEPRKRQNGGTRCPERVGTGPSHRVRDNSIHLGRRTKRKTPDAEVSECRREKMNQERRNPGKGITVERVVPNALARAQVIELGTTRFTLGEGPNAKRPTPKFRNAEGKR